MAPGRQILDEIVDLLKTKFRVRHFPSAKTQSDFHFHFLTEKIDGVLQFHTEIMRINRRAELDFLNFIGVLMFPGFLVLLGLFVTVFAEVDQLADGRSGVRRDLDEIDRPGAGHGQSVI